jgi:hypothetical protein
MPADRGEVDSFFVRYAQRNQLFANIGTGRFQDLSAENSPFCGAPGVSRGLCVGDIDNDGAVDLLVTKIAGPARLYRNAAPRAGHWLSIRAIDSELRRDAYGAEITVFAGNRRQFNYLNPGGSYLSSSDPRLHFGLGDAAEFDEIRVVWPDGTGERFPGGAADRPILLRRGDGTIDDVERE